MARRRRSLLDKIQPRRPSAADDSFWDDLCRRIEQGKVIPILSESVQSDVIFHLPDEPAEQPAPDDSPPDAVLNQPALTVLEELANLWADSIGYPLGDRHRLARVAQYNAVRSIDQEQAKNDYLSFLKWALLRLAEGDEQVADLVEELEDQANELSFTDLAAELEYPQFPRPESDPLRLLARLPLPIYITTSYHEFVEQALQREGRTPRTQVCLWRGEFSSGEQAALWDPDYLPSPAEPVVYHLHGHEDYPSTLVLSEDDYLDYLVRITQPIDPARPMIPYYLREALAESSLLLLGYRLQDWDFRVLFRGLIQANHNSLRLFSLAIQLDPSAQEGIANPQEARRYLESYFEPSRFKVSWGSVQAFSARLWDEWNRWRRA